MTPASAGSTRAVAAVAAVLVSIAASNTEATAASNDPVTQGIALRRAGDDQGAMPLFEQAYHDTHAPRAAAQLGLCEQALGRWVDAETHVTEALKADDAWVKEHRNTLDKALIVIKSKIGRLEVTGEPTGAAVLVNGLEVGKLPLSEPIRVPAGELQIELRQPGYQPAARTIRVDGGAYRKIALHAEREVASAPPPATAPSSDTSTAEPIAASSAAATETATASDEASAPAAWRAPVRWVSLGLGAASLGVGIYGILHNRSIVTNQFDPSCGIDHSGQAQPTMGSSLTAKQCADLKSQYESASTLGAIGLVGAAVFVTAGVVLWLTDPAPGPVRTALTHCDLTPASGRLAAGCVFTF